MDDKLTFEPADCELCGVALADDWGFWLCKTCIAIRSRANEPAGCAADGCQSKTWCSFCPRHQLEFQNKHLQQQRLFLP